MSRRNLNYFWSLLPGVLTVAGNLLGGPWVFANAFFTLGLLAAVEWFIPEDTSNQYTEDSLLPNLIMVLHVLLQLAAVGTLLRMFFVGEVPWWQMAGAGLSTGVHSGSSAIVLAHEMIHRKQQVWQVLGKVLLFTCGNCYFFVEHLRVHHKWVATGRDPATARKGENVYSFFIRSSIGQILGAWRLEAERLRSQGRSVLHPSNYVFTSNLLLLALLIGLYSFDGLYVVSAFLLQCLFANFLLEYTNYIEHYGLTRAENERATELHSWQTDKVISRFMLIDLARHADHHYYASKPYHQLVSYPASPVLPGGYASSIYLAMIPPLWFRMVDARLDRFLASSR
jgi:alkane 1-monooxygenase